MQELKIVKEDPDWRGVEWYSNYFLYKIDDILLLKQDVQFLSNHMCYLNTVTPQYWNIAMSVFWIFVDMFTFLSMQSLR